MSNTTSTYAGEALLPKRVTVTKLISSRYDSGVSRPLSWSERIAGQDSVEIEGNEVVALWSDGGQSAPQPGWVLMLLENLPNKGYHWTLYGYAS